MRAFVIALASTLTALLLAEGLCRVLPVSTATMSGYYADDDVMSYPPGHRFTVATGWDLRNPQRLRANNWGFVSDLDFVPDSKAVALIGDSFVEASMLGDTDRPARQLFAALGERRPVYGLGSPGTALLDYAQRIRLASQRLGVRDFVVWADAGDTRQALCGSGNVHSRCLDPSSLAPRIERQALPGVVKRLARHSALLQYVFSQLKLDGGQLFRELFTRKVPHQQLAADSSQIDSRALQRAITVIDAVADNFFREVAPFRSGRLIFVIDGRRSAKEPQGDLRDMERLHLIARLRAGGAEVVDLEPVFRSHLRNSRLSLEVGPYDAHLNSLGVRLVMEQAAAALKGGLSR